MKRSHNILLIIAVIVLAVCPLFLVQKPAPDANGERAEIFAGADDKARHMVSEIDPNYKPWFEPLIEPASAEIASLLFALQAAIGAGVIGYYLGSAVTRDKMQRAQNAGKNSGKA